MQVTDVRIKLADHKSNNDRILAYASVCVDGKLVIYDLKVIDGPKGVFVSMPSRKRTDLCPCCKGKNHLQAKFCNNCGAQLDPDRASYTAPVDQGGRLKIFHDICHPVEDSFRNELVGKVLDAYDTEAQAEEVRWVHDKQQSTT